MKPIQELALSKIKLPKGVREKVKPGEYSGTITVQVAYSLQVADDTERRPSASIPWQDIAVAALSMLSQSKRDEAIRDGFTGQVDETRKDEITAPLQLAAERIAAVSDTSPVKGAVTGQVQVTEIRTAPAIKASV